MNGLLELFTAFIEYIEEEREYVDECDPDHYFANKVKRLERILNDASSDIVLIAYIMECLNDEAQGDNWKAQA